MDGIYVSLLLLSHSSSAPNRLTRSWDKQLFPDHVSFLSELHKRDLKTTLNVHPADGIRSYEKPYAEMCTMFDRDASKKVVCAFSLVRPSGIPPVIYERWR